MNTGLSILRQIDPSPTLYDRLAELQQISALDDGTYWVDDAQPRDQEYTDEIVNVATLGWVVFDLDGQLHAKYRSLNRAMKAVASATAVIKTEVEFDEPADED